jgi:hypothetical protein
MLISVEELRFEVEKKPMKLLIDNKSTVNFANNENIENMFHYLREQVNNGIL